MPIFKGSGKALCLFLLAVFSCAAQVPKLVTGDRPPLTAGAFLPLPLTAVKPTGWLREQLRVQADGLTGHLDEFWPDLRDSAWLGKGGEGWERGPYYLDGLVPLAYLLDDAKLIEKSRKWIEWTLTHQRADGAIGPEKNIDWWPNMVMAKALTQYAEATGDPRVVPLLSKYFAYHAAQLDKRPLHEWAQYRWQEEVLTILWLYNRTGDPALVDLAKKLKAQGYDWRKHFEEFSYPNRLEGKEQMTLATHGVNNAMALKAGAISYLLSGDPGDRAVSSLMLDRLYRYHGLANGMFSSSEHYAGKSPSQGIELCAVVEAMFSLEIEGGILGDASMGDRLEQIAYNALPATLSADMWSHQYDQQPNQVMCSLANRNWTDNGPESNLFGLEPNFGCCTANLHQGWPKFVANLWMATGDGGLALAAYGPSEVLTLLVGDTRLDIREETEYPFRDRVRLVVSPSRKIRFPLELRIPRWAKQASVEVNHQPVDHVIPGAYLRVEREWAPGDVVELRFPMEVRTVRDYNDSVVLQRGPLIFSLPLGESWRKLRDSGPGGDWELFPTTPWNYGLLVGKQGSLSSVSVEERSVGKQPFSLEGAPVLLHVTGRRVPDWQIVDDSAAPPPVGPVATKSPVSELTLAPYGSARLRVTAFPVVE
jgi:hypothetical protein